LFTSAGDYLICWKPPYISYDGYVRASDSYWTVVGVPSINKLIENTFKLNENFVKLDLSGTVGYKDQYQLFTGTPDCNSGSEVGDLITNDHKNSYFYTWFPDTSLAMHFCWRTLVTGSYSSWQRMAYSNGTAYSVTITDISATTQTQPKILEFSHAYGSVVTTKDVLWFSFVKSGAGHANVVPSNNPHDSTNGVFRVLHFLTDSINLSSAVQVDYEFDASFSPNQGSISCQKSGEQSGKCFIENMTLENNSKVCLFFYSNSFSYSDGTTRHYLFGDQATTKTMYSHCVYVKNQMIISKSTSTNVFTYQNDRILPIDLQENITTSFILPYESINGISNTFLTNAKPAYSIWLTLKTTGTACSTPTAIVNFQNMIDMTVFSANLDLKDCPVGNVLYADITVNFIKSDTNYDVEYKDVLLGTIGCHPD